MPALPVPLAAPPISVAARAPDCRVAQLRLEADGRDGDFNGMSHSGTALVIRNTGLDCTLAALPKVEFRDARGRVLPAVRRAPVGMHPGPVMVPLRLQHGRRASTDLRWVSGPVYPHNRSLRAASVTVRIGTTVLRTTLTAVLYGETGKAVGFDQTALRTLDVTPATAS